MKTVQKYDNEPVRSRLQDKQLYEISLPNGETLSLQFEAGVLHAFVIGKPADCGCCMHEPTTRLRVYNR